MRRDAIDLNNDLREQRVLLSVHQPRPWPQGEVGGGEWNRAGRKNAIPGRLRSSLDEKTVLIERLDGELRFRHACVPHDEPLDISHTGAMRGIAHLTDQSQPETNLLRRHSIAALNVAAFRF